VTLYHRDKSTEIHNGDCLQVLRTLPDSSVDSCVTDPPYGLAFMGKRWDYDVPSSEVWQEVLRVLKPGGHLLAFAGTRTQHRMAVRIEDAGFEIRDMIAWVYGSGFPKSLDVSKAIDKQRDDSEEIHAVVRWLEQRRQDAGVSRSAVERHFGTQNIGQALFTITPGSTSRVATWDQWQELKTLLKFDDSMDAEVWRLNGNKGQPGKAWFKREVIKEDKRFRNGTSWEAKSGMLANGEQDFSITAPATEAARQWSGWGTALKPALEPITMARAPVSGTVAANVLEHGTGAINVDGCRVGDESGRFPANLIHDGSDEVTGLFPEDDGESASRFFYCAKADASERRNSKHPTVKPVALMRYLVRLVCPAGGLVLDPFAGSGTTIEAARLEHCRAIGIEREAEYCADILERLRQGVLF